MAVFGAAEALEMAVRIEENGAAFYSAAADKTEDSDLRDLFVELADREVEHRRVFESMAERAEPASGSRSSEVGDYTSFLEVALDHAVFSGQDKALRMAEEAETRTEALQAAMGFEKDTMLFYYDLREMVAEKDRVIISGVIQEEKRHLRRLADIV
jgi:rubrerythrin